MPGTAIAPYAQAAAVVKADGTVERSHGVVNVTRVAAGTYTIEVDASIDVAASVPIATLSTTIGAGAIFATAISSNTISVSTLNVPSGSHDWSFNVIVP
jgi:hypothetical protein